MSDPKLPLVALVTTALVGIPLLLLAVTSGLSPGILVLVGFAIIALAFAAVSWYGERHRRDALLTLAANLGLQYRRRDESVARRYRFLDRLCRGENRYAFNILEGIYRGHPVRVFDFHYQTYSRDAKGRRRTEHHQFSCFVLEHPLRAPELLIYPEGLLHRLGKAFGLTDIDFESAEFSQAFVVQCDDKRFAYDICHARMMEYLLANPDLSVEIERDCLSIGFDTRLEVAEIPKRLDQLVELRDLVPGYLLRP